MSEMLFGGIESLKGIGTAKAEKYKKIHAGKDVCVRGKKYGKDYVVSWQP